MKKKEQEKKSTPKRQNVSDNDMENVSGGYNLYDTLNRECAKVVGPVVNGAFEALDAGVRIIYGADYDEGKPETHSAVYKKSGD